MEKNKVQYNLKNVHFAPLLEVDGIITYDAPIPIPGAVSLSVTPVGDSKPFYADGYAYFTSTANGGYEGDLEIALLPESFVVQILGEQLAEKDKVLVETNQAKQSSFALLFQFDGDAKAIKRVLYDCTAARPNIESATDTDTREVKAQTLALKAKARADGKIKAQTTDNTPPAVADGWFSQVWDGDSGVA